MSHESPRFSLWGVLLIAAIVLIAGANIFSRQQNSHAAAQTDAFISDLNAGRLNTAEAFEARCGQPRWTAQTKDGPELHYYAGGDYFVTLTAAGPRLEAEHVEFSGAKALTYRTAVGADFIRERLDCK